MTGQDSPDHSGIRLHPPPSSDFDPFTATEDDLKRHGLPLRPDPQTQPGMAAPWERQASRYRHFEHLAPRPDTATAGKPAVGADALGPSPFESCGYQFFNAGAPFTALFVTWTVPDLQFTPGAFTAVDNLSFQVRRGEVLGFLGPNGAGKSTTMRMLAGFMTPTAGTARIQGHDVRTDSVAARRVLGFLPEGAPTYPEMSVEGFLRFCARIRGFSGSELADRVNHALGLTTLHGVRLQSV